jgi:hypothetical protein
MGRQCPTAGAGPDGAPPDTKQPPTLNGDSTYNMPEAAITAQVNDWKEKNHV